MGLEATLERLATRTGVRRYFALRRTQTGQLNWNIVQLIVGLVIVLIVVAALSSAAFLWGNRVSASAAPAPAGTVILSHSLSSQHGVALVRSLDRYAATASSAASLRGVAGVRAADAGAVRRAKASALHLNGLAALRAIDNR
jgi:hypothetical protein